MKGGDTVQETRNETQMVNGSKLMVEALTDEKVEMLFGYPGGTILPEYDEMYQAEFKNILVRHEQGATHAAEGYAKSTGKTGVVLVTSGPGATNAVTGVADAMRDSVPLVVFTGQVGTGLIGTDAFQEADVLSIYKSISKKAIQIRSATDVANVVHQAFEIAQSGRKGPVVVDLPKNVMSEEVTRAEVKQWESESNFSTELKSDSKEKLKAMMKDLRAAKQPVLLVGGGAIAANASQEFRQFAEKHQIPVISSLLGLGVVHSENPQFMGMAGMHGSFAANKALHNSDFLINIGCRFEDRLATNPKKFAPKAKISHIDIDPNEIGKIIRTDYGVVADAKAALTAMLEEPSTADNHQDWVNETTKRKQDHDYRYHKQSGELKPQQVIEAVGKFTEGKAFVATDVGQHQMWAAQFYPFTFAGQLVTSGGLGTMGFGIPSAIGTQFAHPDDQVVLFTGDGSFQMTSEELDVIKSYGLNIKIVLLNNGVLGMVRQWQDLFYDERRSQTVFKDQPDFQKLAAAYGINSYKIIGQDADWQTILQQALDAPGSALIEVAIPKWEEVQPMIAPGQTNDNMIEFD